MDDNIINFPRIGFGPGSPMPTGDAGDPPPARLDWAPASGTRRSPLDTLAALPAPGLTRPIIPETGFVPDTFRSEPVGEVSGPHLSALSLAAILAVSVAALRGIHSAVTAYRASREQRKTVADLAGGAATKDSSKKKIPSGAEYGHKSLGRGGGGGSKKSSSGSGSPGSSSGGSKGSSGGGRKPSAKSPSTGGSSKTSGSKTGGSSKTGSPNKPKRPGPVHRTSQGGGTGSLKRKKNKPSADATGSDSRKPSKGKGRVKSPRGTSGPKGLLRSMKNRKADKNGPTSSPLTKGKKGAMPPGGAKPSKVRSPKGSGGKRTKLSEAIGKEAGRRLKRRRKNMTKPPIWARQAKAKANTKGPTSKQAGSPKPASTKAKTKARTSSTSNYWGKVRSRARQRWDQRRAAWSTTSTGPSTGPSGPSGSGPSAGTRTRRTPWESAGMATGTDATTTVVYRADKPNPHTGPVPALGVAVPGLPAAPTPHTKRPGTRRPIPMPPAASTPRTRTMSTPARRYAGTPAMDAQHATEVTLDDALDVLEQLTRESFSTHDECVGLAHKARVIRDQLALLAVDLRTTHNVIGGLTAGAMTRLAESMDVLARKADEMQTTSLEAAELSEAADNSLGDAYRPITQATADAGLTVPSARIHNEG